jgi:uncharacterized membrane protein YfcA
VLPDLSLLQMLVIAAAGLGAGIVNAFAGGGTLVAYPVLLALGVPPVSANITCSVGLLPGYAGTASAYRTELSHHRSLIPALAGAAVLGGLGGAVLLLSIPERGFELVVPPLILLGAILLALQPKLAAWVAARPGRGALRAVPIGLLAAVFAAGAYGSFFGAGLGVLLLAALGTFLAIGIQADNALKALLSFVAVAAGVVIFAVIGDVFWLAAALLVVGSLVGGRIGGSIARRLSPKVLRASVVAFAVIVAIVLAVRTYA